MTARLAYYTDKSHPWSCFSEVHVCVFKKDLSCVDSSSFILRQWTHLPRARRQIRLVCQRLTHATRSPVTQKTRSRDVEGILSVVRSSVAFIAKGPDSQRH